MKTSLALLAALVALTVAAAFPTGGSGAGGPLYTAGIVYGWHGVRAPGGEARFVALPASSATVVAAIRVRGGRVLRTRTLRGQFGVPMVAFDGTTSGLSGDGSLLTLASYAPAPRTRGTTRFAVLATRTFRLRRLVSLEGSWSFDAISPDGSTLFLTEHLRAGKNPVYRVRTFDVRSGKLGTTLVDRLENEAEMGGIPVARASSIDGRWAYTLYARQGRDPFVHALDTAKRWALCVDLPLDVSYDMQWALRLKLRQRGEQLTVLKGRTTLATVDTDSWRVRTED